MLNNDNCSAQSGEITPEMLAVLNWLKQDEMKDICVPDVIKAVKHCMMSLTREAGDPFCAECPYNRNHVPGERICDRKLLEDVYAVLRDQSDEIIDLLWKLNHSDDEEDETDEE